MSGYDMDPSGYELNKNMRTESPSEVCRKTGYQQCSQCDDFACHDNTSEARQHAELIGMCRAEPEWAANRIKTHKANEAKLREELERLKQTVGFQEEMYLKTHGGSWGKCKYQANEAKLRECLGNLLIAIRGGGCSDDVWEVAIENSIRNAEKAMEETKP